MKPYILTIILVFSLISPTFAQTNCADVIAKTTDQVSRISYFSSKNPIVVASNSGNKGFEISVNYINDTSAFRVRMIGGGDCIQTGNIILVSFADNTRKITAQSSSNCEQKAMVFWGAPTDDNETFAKITSTRIRKLTVVMPDSPVEANFTPEQADTLINHFKCLKSVVSIPAMNPEIKKPVLKRSEAAN